MSTSSDLGFPTFALVTLVVAAGVIWYTGRRLAADHGSDVRIIWYFFSLAATITMLVILWARSTSAIDDAGGFHGPAGSLLAKAFAFMLDLAADIKFFVSIAALVLLPQALSWALSALFGCAAAPKYVVSTFNFFLWSMLKSFVVAAGIVTVVAIYGRMQGWAGWTSHQAFESISLSLTLIGICFFLLFLHRDLSFGPPVPGKPGRGKFRRTLQSINAWASRRIAQKAD